MMLITTELNRSSPIPNGRAGAKSPEKITVPNETALVTVKSPMMPPEIKFETTLLAAGFEYAMLVTSFRERQKLKLYFIKSCQNLPQPAYDFLLLG